MFSYMWRVMRIPKRREDKARIPRHRHQDRHPREDPREKIARVGRKNVGVRFGRVSVDVCVVECGLNTITALVYCESRTGTKSAI